jgi:hypothetical protein
VQRQRKREPTFAAQEVCRALGIPHGTLNSWAFHGWFEGLDAEKTTPGKARRFTLADLFRLAILKRLVELGITAEKARPWALQCVDYMEKEPISEMNVMIYDDGEIYHIAGPAPAGALLRLTIYPTEIVRTLKERLGVADA